MIKYPIMKSYDGLVAYYGSTNGSRPKLTVLQGKVDSSFKVTPECLIDKIHTAIHNRFDKEDFALCRWPMENMTIYGINLDCSESKAADESELMFTYLILEGVIDAEEIPAILHCFPDIEKEFVKVRNKFNIDEKFIADETGGTKGQ